MQFKISPEFHQQYPDVSIGVLPVFDLTVSSDKPYLDKTTYQAVNQKFGNGIYETEELTAFRKFYERLKLGDQAGFPSVENLLRRFAQDEYVPQINAVVDLANKTALETLIPTGVFDLDAIEGDLELRFSRIGETYQPLGGSLEALPAGVAVIADAKKVLNLFPYRDSVYAKITSKTKNVLVLVDMMLPLKKATVAAVVTKLGEALKTACGGKPGEISFFEKTTNVVTNQATSVESRPHRVFSATRATGRLHLGNYLGAVKGYLALQADSRYESIFMAVDLHTITTPYDAKTLKQASREIILDYLAAGLDPDKVVVTLQSLVPEHAELAFLFSSVVSIARMQHLPTFKDKVKQHPDNVTMALLNYPVLMAADILVYKAGLVPVGIDQEPHLEIAREIARKMNDQFGLDFPEPKRFATVGEYVPSLAGTGKMSKSVEGSYINLTDDLATIKKRLAGAPTDSGRGDKVPTEGGVANLLKFVELFQGLETRKAYEAAYLSTGLRYGDLKNDLAAAIMAELVPIQARRKNFETQPELVEKIILEGAEKARVIARATLKEVKTKMGLG